MIEAHGRITMEDSGAFISTALKDELAGLIARVISRLCEGFGLR
jgi:hypothetical protein